MGRSGHHPVRPHQSASFSSLLSSSAALVFMVYPIIEAVRLAFFSYNPLRPELSVFVGLDNFAYIFDDPLFWDSFRQATIWTLLSILFQTVLGVGSRCCCSRRCRESRCSAACCCSPTSCRRW